MEGKQTAVDYLFEMWLQDKTITQSALEQARVMFQQQLYAFYMQGGVDAIMEADRSVEDFYNETYNPDPE